MRIRRVLLILTALVILTACRLPGRNGAEPPLPTIIPVDPATRPKTTTIPPMPTMEVDRQSGPTPSPTLTKEAVGDTIVLEPTTIPTALTATDVPKPTEAPTPVLVTNTPQSTPLPTETSPSPAPPLGELAISLFPVAGGFAKPLFVTHSGDGSDRLFVVEQGGRIFIAKEGVVNSAPFLDITPIVGSDASEQGLLSVAFHPDYASNGFFFVNYTDKRGDTVIARYQLSTENPDLADSNSSKFLMTIGQPYVNHNGGQLAFGPDGYLYIGTGDGGAANDPQNNGQTLSSLLGKILRIDVDNADPYGVPENNPFVDTEGARPEVWSYGWRNPWRFSFDATTDDLYVADVGQNQYEEIDVELTGTPGGQNYGWRFMEGFHCFNPSECDPTSLGLVLPIAEYDHSQGCSVTGGYVYRGSRYPRLTGVYFYGDFCSGIIWGIRREADGNWTQAELLASGRVISSFGQDETGEVYLVDHKGDILLIGN
jgi:glucose/arabinose dehydrogenase